MKLPLHKYQQVCHDKVVAGDSNTLFLEMGLGKTLVTLSILQTLRPFPVLILAPRMICDTVWAQEVEKWGLGFSVCHLSGSPAQRLKELQNPQHDIYLMTYQLLKWLASTGLFPFDYVVFDELSCMKNHSSKRFGIVRRLLKKHPFGCLGLGGTPVPNGYTGLWSQMYCMDEGATFGKRVTPWLNTHFRNTSPSPDYATWTLIDGEGKKIRTALKKSGVIALTAKAVIGQSDPIELPAIPIRLPARAAAIYEELEKEFIAQVGNSTIIPPNAAVTGNKLRQVASGFIYDTEAGAAIRLHTEKIDALKAYVESMDGTPLLVVFTFKEELVMLREAFKDLPVLAGGVPSEVRRKRINAWNAGELPVLAVQPAAAGHGVNLQAGGHHILFYSVDWNLETYQQVIARLNRQGQQNPVFIRHMLVPYSEEARVLRGLIDKAKVQEHLMETLSEKVLTE